MSETTVSTVRSSALVRVERLRVKLDFGPDVVSDVSFVVRTGELVGLVGESGSGKTTIASALLAHTRSGARVAGGRILIDGSDVLQLGARDLRRVRGKVIAYVSQDPATALNPLLRIGAHLLEVLRVHLPELNAQEKQERVLSVLDDVELPSDQPFLQRFPHQLSGGQQQRVLLAMAFILRSKVVVLDEPTTALDVSTQAKILRTIRRLCCTYGVSALYVSHNLAAVHGLVDRVLVVYAGRVVEAASRDLLFATPRHPYTQGLFAALPDIARRLPLLPIPGRADPPGARPSGCAFAPRCASRGERCGEVPPLNEMQLGHEVACFYPPARGDEKGASSERRRTIESADIEANQRTLLKVRGLSASYGDRQVLADAMFDVSDGECVALVGESGSGKTTLSRALVGLGERVSGEVFFDGNRLPPSVHERTLELRRQIQYIFQNPHRALNPRQTVATILRSAIRHWFDVGRQEADSRVSDVLARVALEPRLRERRPGDLSGGERQRVAIARALVSQPRLLICDEITSSLDVSVQATILQLLRALQDDGLAILFVTHDLGVVRAIADRAVVLHRGRVVETGATDLVLDHSRDSYTRSLVTDSPSLASSLGAKPLSLDGSFGRPGS